MLYKYKEAFSLRDDDWHMSQHRCRNRCHGQIPISITPYHVKEKDMAYD